MTAEIAVMNKSGVALAADSKVTIGGGIKAFDTVTKIFPLSRVHPDVALISKGDGLIWIKRKHYFAPELNPQFAAKYLSAIMGGAYEKPSIRRSGRKNPKSGDEA